MYKARKYGEKYGWTEDVYFNWPTSTEHWTPGYICKNAAIGDPRSNAKENV